MRFRLNFLCGDKAVWVPWNISICIPLFSNLIKSLFYARFYVFPLSFPSVDKKYLRFFYGQQLTLICHFSFILNALTVIDDQIYEYTLIPCKRWVLGFTIDRGNNMSKRKSLEWWRQQLCSVQFRASSSRAVLPKRHIYELICALGHSGKLVQKLLNK